MTNAALAEAQLATRVAISKLPPALQDLAARQDAPIFHSACAAGEIDLVRGLLDAGLPPDTYPCTEDENDEPPLTWIARYRDLSDGRTLEIAQLLIDRGANVDEGMPLAAAIVEGDVLLAQLLLAAGADVEQVLDELDESQQRLLESLTTGLN
jgi:ankyrin repeat protein